MVDTSSFVCIGSHLHIYTLGPFSKGSQVGFPTLEKLEDTTFSRLSLCVRQLKKATWPGWYVRHKMPKKLKKAEAERKKEPLKDLRDLRRDRWRQQTLDEYIFFLCHVFGVYIIVFETEEELLVSKQYYRTTCQRCQHETSHYI